MHVIAHRGASSAYPENTPDAFRAADEMGADGVELDVRIAFDGAGSQRLVVHHDPLPSDRTLVDALASLDEVLDACGSRMLVNVEIKNSHDDGGFDPTMAVVAPTLSTLRRRRTPQRWLVSSFSLATVDHCRLVAPEIATALLVNEATDASIADATRGGHVAIHPWAPSLDADCVDACHAAGLVVNTWTCNDGARILDLDRLGVDGVCTDVPDVVLAALGRESGLDLTLRWGSARKRPNQPETPV